MPIKCQIKHSVASASDDTLTDRSLFFDRLVLTVHKHGKNWLKSLALIG